MTPTDPQPVSGVTPTLIPGVAASTWSRAATVAVYFTIPAYLVLGFFRLFARDNFAAFNVWFIPTIVYAGVSFATSFTLGILAARRTNREAKAGYTTQWRSQPTLPQLDAASGAVIRKAGEPYVKRSAWREREFAGAMGTTDAPNPSPWEVHRPSPWLSFLALLPSLIIPAVAFVGLIGVIGGAGASFGTRLTIATVVVVGSLALILGISALVVSRRLAHLRAAAPNDLDFVFAKSKGYADGFEALTAEKLYESTGVVRGASANASGLTIWHGNPPEKVATLAWTAVTAVQIDNVPGGNRSNNMILVTFRTSTGALATLPLAYPKYDAFPVPSKASVTWLIGQLNELRSGPPTARPL